MPYLVSLVVPLLLVAAVICVFAQTRHFDFLTYDDSINVYANPHLNTPVHGIPTITMQEIAQFWQHAYYELYTPVTYTIWGACARFARLSTPQAMPGEGWSTLSGGVFHMVGVLFHVANALFVYLLLCRCFAHLPKMRRRIICGIGAFLYALHPLQVEAVAWVTGNNNLFSAFFVFLSLWAFLRFAHPQERETKNAPLWFTLATLAYALALLAKPTAVVTPLFALILFFAPLSGTRRVGSRVFMAGLLLWLALAAACAVITKLSSMSEVLQTPLFVRPFLAGDALAFYITKVVWPHPLCVDYGHGQAIVWSSWWGYITWILPTLVGIGLWRVPGELGKRLRTGALLFGAGVLPVLGFIPYYYHPISTVADRYLYLSLFGIAFGVTAVLSDDFVWRRKAVVLPIAGSLLFACTAKSMEQATHWQNMFALSQHTVRVNPRSWRSQSDLGNAFLAQNRLAEAVAAYRIAHTLNPAMPMTTLNLGIGLIRLREFAEAESVFRELLNSQPGSATVRCNLSSALLGLGRIQEAVAIARDAVRAKPDFAESHYHLGVALVRSGKAAAGADSLRSAVRLAPRQPQMWFQLALACQKSVIPADKTQAKAAAREALRLAPLAKEAGILRQIAGE